MLQSENFYDGDGLDSEILAEIEEEFSKGAKPSDSRLAHQKAEADKAEEAINSLKSFVEDQLSFSFRNANKAVYELLQSTEPSPLLKYYSELS